MKMIFTAISALAAASVAAATLCAEANKFGALTITPSTALAGGSNVTGSLDLTCPKEKGYFPTYVDYYLEVPQGNNGYEWPVLLAHNEVDASATSDTFNTALPYITYFNASYVVYAQFTYARTDEKQNTYYLIGGTSSGVNITANNS
ncbi:hypothetical protein CONPUDRAFT_93718 [Coniophora puteana RWD-64-598 SS2]|uniref:Uncharacterized protein n=1 Tax=Coniophora puteana (strain RWD-64-598) TaxID=741705 RepID=A0A5M3M890_CONPW|nr:uncharacterized protein CONPUDRAFT_93718 [Coniophora puteana RWD-64-598 SS2]EIW75005.1 hypothetical protein CONPUDRAFT_93718 [Coniophora puteana RWD-64-598 SS2]